MKYGFIGLGNMAGAIIAGMAACGKFKNDYLYGFNRSQGKTLALKEKHGLIPCASAAEVAEKADVIILAVKPQVLPEVMPEIVKGVTKDKTVISIAAGKSTGWYEERLAKGVPVVRCMPNINAKVKASVTAICGGKGATADDIKIADGIFSSVGKIYHIEEKCSRRSARWAEPPVRSFCFTLTRWPRPECARDFRAPWPRRSQRLPSWAAALWLWTAMSTPSRS